MKICFLGAASVGKSTFLAALSCKQPDTSGAYWHYPMDKQDGSPNEDSKRIAEAAEAIKDGNSLPATTEIHSGEGIIHFPEQSNDLCVEYIDFPGSAFSKGYDSSDAESIKEIREHVKSCDCIYLFIEPDDLSRDGGASRIKTFLNVFYDCKEQKEKNSKSMSPYVCLALTKADSVDDEDIRDGKSTPTQVKEYFETHAGDNLTALINEVGDDRLFYATFSTLRDGKLNINAEEFKQLFYPLVNATNVTVRWKKILRCILTFLAIIACIVLSLCISKEWQKQTDTSTMNEIQKLRPVTIHNIKTLESKIKEIRDQETRVREERALQEEKENLKRKMTDDVKNAKRAYYMNPSDENKRMYNNEYERYKKGFDDIPDTLVINPIVEELPIIDDILHTRNTSNHLPSYLNARNHKIQEYLRRFSHDCTEVEQINQAIQISQMLSEMHRYTMSVKVKMKDDNRMAFMVQTKRAPIGKNYPDDEKDEVKAKGFKKQSEFNEKISFEWDASKPLELHAWNNNYNWGTLMTFLTSFTGRIAPAPGEKFPIRHFCNLTQATLTDTDKDWHKEIRITTHIHANERKIETSDIDLVERYIYDNAYWQERRNSVQEIINDELNEL